MKMEWLAEDLITSGRKLHKLETLRVRFFTKFWLRIRVRTNVENCRSRLRIR